jgi:hypothetical protein
MEQMKCSNSACGGALLTGDLFCGKCGTPTPGARRPGPTAHPGQSTQHPAPRAQPPARGPGSAVETSGTLNWEQPAPADGYAPFFDHQPRRPPEPLSNTTRYLCAAAYLDNGFANRVIRELIASRRAVAPSLGFDVGPVIRHCLRARRNLLTRDIVLAVLVIIGLILSPLVALDFLLVTLVLGVLLPNARWKRRGPVGKVLFAVGIVAGTAVAGLFSFLLAVGTVASVFAPGSNTVPGALAKATGVAATFGVLLAGTWATQFVFTRTTLRTLTEHLRPGAPPPDPTSSAAEPRIAMVEGAQQGNITLYGQEELHGKDDPFIGVGVPLDRHWAIAIKLDPANPARQGLRARAAADGYVAVDPVELHQTIRERLLSLNDPALPVNERISALTVTDRLAGSGTLRWTSPLLDRARRTPYSHASPEAVKALIRHPQAGLRYYQQVSVSDEGPPVTSHGRQVLEGTDQGIAVSAFVYAAVEGRMFYLQFILTALPPVSPDYRIIDLWPDMSSARFQLVTLSMSVKTLFRSVAYAPAGIYGAFRLWLSERRQEKKALSSDGSVAGDLGAQVSVRQLGTVDDYGSYIRERDVEKYNRIIERLLLETVQDFLAAKGVDISAFAGSANSVINGDVISIGSISGGDNTIGGHGHTLNQSASSHSAT